MLMRRVWIPKHWSVPTNALNHGNGDTIFSGNRRYKFSRFLSLRLREKTTVPLVSGKPAVVRSNVVTTHLKGFEAFIAFTHFSI